MEQSGRKFAGAAIAVVLVAAILGSLVDGELDRMPKTLPASYKAKGSDRHALGTTTISHYSPHASGRARIWRDEQPMTGITPDAGNRCSAPAHAHAHKTMN